MRRRRRRSRGSGTVYFSKSERVWIAQVSLGVVAGRRVRRRVRCADEDEADRELDRLQRAYGAGVEPAMATLDAYLTDWLRSHGPSVRASTTRSYEGHIRLHISPLLGGIPVARLRTSDVRRLIADRSTAGLKPATVERIIATLRAALQQAVDDRALSDNVAVGVDLPRIDRQSVTPLTEDEADRIREAVSGAWMADLVELLLGSGLRLGEACGLDQGDVDLGGSFVIVRHTKTSVRAVPVSDDAVGALRHAMASAPRIGRDEPVFYGQRTGARLRPASVSHAFPRVLERAGLERLTPHGLRHGAATLMVTRGVHMRVIAEQLGHRNPALTARLYAHVVPGAQREAVRTLNRRSPTR